MKKPTGRSVGNMDYFNPPTLLRPSILFSLTVTTLRPKNSSATTKRRAARKLGRSGLQQKPSPAAVTLADFFKVKAKADRLHSGGLLLPGKAASTTAGCSSSGPDGTMSRHKHTATSLILFEEVKQEHKHMESQCYTHSNVPIFHPGKRLMIQSTNKQDTACLALCLQPFSHFRTMSMRPIWDYETTEHHGPRISCATCQSGPQQVDVIFDDDVGFLSAIKTFMLTTKRPVILTTSGRNTHPCSVQ